MVNAPLMGQIADLIRANPERHRQSSWTRAGDAGLTRFWATVEELRAYASSPIPATIADLERPICTTTGCVAGWAVILAAPAGTRIEIGGDDVEPADKGDPTTVGRCAEYLLELEREQAEYLFSEDRSRQQVLGALDYLPGHPRADCHELARECGG